MPTYLISTCRKHYTVAHLLAQDSIHALCTYKPGEKTWPRVDGEVAGGKWILSDERGDRLVCSYCKSRQRQQNEPPAPKTNKRLAREIERWRKFTGTELTIERDE